MGFKFPNLFTLKLAHIALSILLLLLPIVISFEMSTGLDFKDMLFALRANTQKTYFPTGFVLQKP